MARKRNWVVAFKAKEIYNKYRVKPGRRYETPSEAKDRIQRMWLNKLDGTPKRHFLYDAEVISVSPER